MAMGLVSEREAGIYHKRDEEHQVEKLAVQNLRVVRAFRGEM
jgi:hypothetical protein